jgi:hypothetical protein
MTKEQTQRQRIKVLLHGLSEAIDADKAYLQGYVCKGFQQEKIIKTAMLYHRDDMRLRLLPFGSSVVAVWERRKC